MTVRILNCDVMEGLRQLPDESVHCVVTSPPYFGLRDYGVEGQIGLETSMWDHLAKLVDVFGEVRRVLRSDGTCFMNYGDAYANDGKWGGQTSGKQAYLDEASRNRNGREKRITGLKPKDRMLLPARLAIALQEDGWWVRDEIIWHKPNPMPSPGRGRTTPAHEMVYMLTKSAQYTFDQSAYAEPANVADWNDGSRVYGGANKAGANPQHGARTTGRRTGKMKVPGGWDTSPGGHGTINKQGRTEAQYVEAANSEFRNKRSVWTVATSPYAEAHFATFPPDLIEPMIKAGTSEKGCCFECGAQWVRETERIDKGFDGSKYGARAVAASGGAKTGGSAKSTLGSNNGKSTGHLETVGWRPICSCDAAIIACTVLDPFGGAGTTGMVADRLQRNAILIEINPEYAAMAKRRLEGDAPLFAEVQG